MNKAERKTKGPISRERKEGQPGGAKEIFEAKKDGVSELPVASQCSAAASYL